MQSLKKLCDPSRHVFSSFLEFLIPRPIHSNILLCQLDSVTSCIFVPNMYTD